MPKPISSLEIELFSATSPFAPKKLIVVFDEQKRPEISFYFSRQDALLYPEESQQEWQKRNQAYNLYIQREFLRSALIHAYYRHDDEFDIYKFKGKRAPVHALQLFLLSLFRNADAAQYGEQLTEHYPALVALSNSILPPITVPSCATVQQALLNDVTNTDPDGQKIIASLTPCKLVRDKINHSKWIFKPHPLNTKFPEREHAFTTAAWFALGSVHIPESRLVLNEENHRVGTLSKFDSNFIPFSAYTVRNRKSILPQLNQQYFIQQGFAEITTLFYFFENTDFHSGNWGAALNKNFLAIDFGRACWSTLSKYHGQNSNELTHYSDKFFVHEKQRNWIPEDAFPRNITAINEDLHALPELTNAQPINWPDRANPKYESHLLNLTAQLRQDPSFAARKWIYLLYYCLLYRTHAQQIAEFTMGSKKAQKKFQAWLEMRSKQILDALMMSYEARDYYLLYANEIKTEIIRKIACLNQESQINPKLLRIRSILTEFDILLEEQYSDFHTHYSAKLISAKSQAKKVAVKLNNLITNYEQSLTHNESIIDNQIEVVLKEIQSNILVAKLLVWEWLYAFDKDYYALLQLDWQENDADRLISITSSIIAAIKLAIREQVKNNNAIAKQNRKRIERFSQQITNEYQAICRLISEEDFTGLWNKNHNLLFVSKAKDFEEAAGHIARNLDLDCQPYDCQSKIIDRIKHLIFEKYFEVLQPYSIEMDLNPIETLDDLIHTALALYHHHDFAMQALMPLIFYHEFLSTPQAQQFDILASLRGLLLHSIWDKSCRMRFITRKSQPDGIVALNLAGSIEEMKQMAVKFTQQNKPILRRSVTQDFYELVAAFDIIYPAEVYGKAIDSFKAKHGLDGAHHSAVMAPTSISTNLLP